MLRADRTATSVPSATAVITVDPVGDEHRALFPGLLDWASHVIAVRRNSRLVDVDAIAAPNPQAVPALRARARMVAAELDGAYFEPCGYCGISCSPADRAEHERFARTSETTYRVRWAA